MQQPPILWQYTFSNFNEKARWALDFKRIAHVRRSLLPGEPRALMFSRRGTLPVLDLDGERVADSTRIIAALEHRCPQPALYPADAAERERALELEDFFDEHAGHELRRAVFYDLRDERDYIGAYLTTGQGVRTGAMFRRFMSLPGSMAYANRRYEINEPAAALAREKLVAALDRIVAETGPSGYLVGSDFSVADLTAAALMFPIVWPAELQYDYPDRPATPFSEALDEHPALDWVRQIYREHRGASMEIAR